MTGDWMNYSENQRRCSNPTCFCSGACIGMNPLENKPFVLKSENWVDLDTMKPKPKIKPLNPLPFDDLSNAGYELTKETTNE